MLGEVPKAFVAKKAGMKIDEDEIIDYCKKRLAKYKIPDQIEFVKALPRNASGKVLKTELRSALGKV